MRLLQEGFPQSDQASFCASMRRRWAGNLPLQEGPDHRPEVFRIMEKERRKGNGKYGAGNTLLTLVCSVGPMVRFDNSRMNAYLEHSDAWHNLCVIF